MDKRDRLLAAFRGEGTKRGVGFTVLLRQLTSVK